LRHRAAEERGLAPGVGRRAWRGTCGKQQTRSDEDGAHAGPRGLLLAAALRSVATRFLTAASQSGSDFVCAARASPSGTNESGCVSMR
jgi:hypothetical protein